MVYEKVKFVRGAHFVTVEEGERLSESEMKELITRLSKDKQLKEVDHLSIMLDHKFSRAVEEQLVKNRFQLHDELVFVQRDLSDLPERNERYELKSLRDLHPDTFKDVWQKAMQGSLNAPSYLNMDQQMRSVQKELGPTYKETCNVAYEKDEPVGVVLPHIEPGTNDEGRIFYFGLVPEQRGKHKAVDLYYQALGILKRSFGATYSVGGTSIKNEPMRRVFDACGCEETSRVKLYKRSKPK